jgi:N-formylglutamate amidohydrolase
MAESPAEPPFIRTGPEEPASPVVLSVPHAGRAYSSALLAAARLPLHRIETLEDRLVDRLVWRAVQAGASALIAQAPRAEIDLNRDEREMDPALVAPPLASGRLLQSARTRGGLGLIPSRIAGAGAIWLARIPAQELERRVASIHRPYHAALADMLARTRRRFGVAVLLDCHSMPARTGGARKEPEIVFGDRYGTSIAPDYFNAAIAAAEAQGFTTARNHPYAGGHITARHGRPGAGIHALQVEIDRAAYLAPDMRSPGPGFDRTARMIAAVAEAIAARIIEPPAAIAAE